MSVLLGILKWIGLVILGFLLLLLFVCHFPVSLEAERRDGRNSAFLRFLFVKVNLLRSRKEKKEERDGKEGEKILEIGTVSETAETAKKDEESLAEIVETIKQYLDPSMKAVRYIGKHARLTDVTAQINVKSNDAAFTGITAGIAWSLIGNMMSLLNRVFGAHVSYGPMNVYTYFEDEQLKESLIRGKLKIKPVSLIPAGILFILGRREKKKELKAAACTEAKAEEE